MNNLTEYQMMIDVYNKLIYRNSYKDILLEVPFMSRCIDMIIIDTNNKIISIEFKIEKWNNAITQALDHNMGADLSYICIPQKSKAPSAKLLQRINETGIGLFYYNPMGDNPLIEVIPYVPKQIKIDLWTKSLKDKINVISDIELFKCTH